jgi:ATP-binding cassette subfamily E protein 1
MMLDRDVDVLSGGELQRVAIAECLSRDADIYLLDEPSAYLDVEERLAMAKAIRRITKMAGVTAFVVEHDIVTQDFIADRLMVFFGEAGHRGQGGTPLRLEEGMNAFLSDMRITFRRDQDTKRPRVNKEGSRLDKEQKRTERYYYA